MLVGPNQAASLLPKMPRVGVVPFKPLRLSDAKPKLLLGPPGSGKSTRMSEAARHYADNGVPFLFMRFREPLVYKPALFRAAEEAEASLFAAAQHLFASIDYPSSPSLIERLCRNAMALRITRDGIHFDADAPVASRVRNALEDVVTVAAQLGLERRNDRTIKDEELTTPVIFADNSHDLLRHGEHGRVVFKQHMDNVISSTTGTAHFRYVAANSDSGGEIVCLSDAASTRISVEYQEDVLVEEAKAGLLARGHSKSDVEEIIRTCGGRRRLLRPFLDVRWVEDDCGRLFMAPLYTREEAFDATQTLEDIVTKAAARIDKLGDRVLTSPDEKVHMAAILDQLAAGDKVVEGRRLPASYRVPFPHKVLFLGPGGRLFFESEAVKVAWLAIRTRWI